jgi:hypothetical protein
MALLKPRPAVPASNLTWDSGNKQFVGEISDIGGSFGRVWDDSCDEGLTLTSRYPGRDDIVFAVAHVEMDRERDILWWDLTPAAGFGQRAAAFTVRIFND